MKRSGGKTLVMTAVAVISAAVLAATAFAAATNVSGYEALKQSGFTILELRGNSTSSVNVELYADGEKVASENELSQINEQQDTRFTRREVFSISEGISWMEHYWGNGYLYYVYSDNPDQYDMNSFGSGYRGNSQLEFTDNQKKLAGILMDLFTGDIKNYFTMDGNTVSISLSRNQIPELVQSFLAVGAEKAIHDRSNNRSYNTSEMENILARYLYDPVIESGSMTVVLADGGYPSDIDARFDFSGRDENGAPHNASMIINMSFSDIGSTEVNVFNPEGKTQRNHGNVERVYYSDEIGYHEMAIEIGGSEDIIITIPEEVHAETDGFAVEIDIPEQ